MKFFLSLVGLILVLEGLPYAAFPEPMQQWLARMAVMPPRLLRLFGLVAMGCGLFLCYLTQRTTFFG